MADLKLDLLRFCEDQVGARLSRIEERIRSLQESLDSETKSSAGDKHETGRAMIHLEREKLGQQLLMAEKAKELLAMVDIEKKSKNIRLGSLVHTSSQSYFIAISAGEYKSEDTSVFCVSLSAPIGQLMLGKSKGDHFTFNNKTFEIFQVL
ncbi:MAG: 3-oxoacyl-ACP synthase [Flavobacteriaceae bacterium]